MTGQKNSIQVHDSFFEPLLTHEQLLVRITEMAREVKGEYKEKNPIFIGVLNGAFRFAATLSEGVDFPCEFSFLRVHSYQGTHSTGQLHSLLGLKESLKNRHVVVLEDIVESGRTLLYLKEELEKQDPASLAFATLLLKPEVYPGEVELKYVGFKIPPAFVVGFGLDYDGLGRNLNGIYSKVD